MSKKGKKRCFRCLKSAYVSIKDQDAHAYISFQHVKGGTFLEEPDLFYCGSEVNASIVVVVDHRCALRQVHAALLRVPPCADDSEYQTADADQSEASGESDPSSTAAAATKIQAAFRGYRVRKELKPDNGPSGLHKEERELVESR